MKDLQLEHFPSITFDKLRYADTDRQGHVNNAVFSTFLETGRVSFLYNADMPVLPEGASFVIASLQLNFLREIKWPGQVDIGTGILRIGNSSLQLLQHLFQNGQRVATAETVVVQVDDASGKSRPITAEAKAILQDWILTNSKE